MAGVNINRVVLTGNLTRDPEVRETSGGTSVCSLRIAVSERSKDQETGEWGDRASYFDVTVFGGLGETAARYLAKGRAVAIDGRLRWREWTSNEGASRQAVEVIADTVQFLSPAGEDTAKPPSEHEVEGDVPMDTFDMSASAAPEALDDVPF